MNPERHEPHIIIIVEGFMSKLEGGINVTVRKILGHDVMLTTSSAECISWGCQRPCT